MDHCNSNHRFVRILDPFAWILRPHGSEIPGDIVRKETQSPYILGETYVVAAQQTVTILLTITIIII